MADGAFFEPPSAVPPWPYSRPRWYRPAVEPHHPPRRLPSHRAELARPHRPPPPAAPLVALPPVRPAPARRAPPRPAPPRRARLRPTPPRPVIARRRRRARRRTRSPPRPRAPAEVGRPGSSTSCCSSSAFWRSWPVPGASPTGERSCGTADRLWPRASWRGRASEPAGSPGHPLRRRPDWAAERTVAAGNSSGGLPPLSGPRHDRRHRPGVSAAGRRTASPVIGRPGAR